MNVELRIVLASEVLAERHPTMDRARRAIACWSDKADFHGAAALDVCRLHRFEREAAVLVERVCNYEDRGQAEARLLMITGEG
jgi:hypothetical protein